MSVCRVGERLAITPIRQALQQTGAASVARPTARPCAVYADTVDAQRGRATSVSAPRRSTQRTPRRSNGVRFFRNAFSPRPDPLPRDAQRYPAVAETTIRHLSCQPRERMFPLSADFEAASDYHSLRARIRKGVPYLIHRLDRTSSVVPAERCCSLYY